MELRKLGTTDIDVTSICLGTMTWGQQNSEDEAHDQLDYAVSERGVNFIDTAEMYPVPGKRETQGRTEDYIGSWLAARGKRDDVVLATKVVGRSGMVWTRDDQVEQCRHTREQIDMAVEQSLRRLRTDYIDLYQLHWPDRDLPAFGMHSYDDYDADDMVPLLEILETLQRHVDAGRIRHVGLSNESAWGTMKFVALAEAHGLPRMQSNQCVYSLIARRFDYDRAEVAMREKVGLLAYSPLAMGVLTGKYDDGTAPEGSRGALFDGFMSNYMKHEESWLDANATARKLGLTPTQFALKFVESRDFVTSNIIGATSIEQLSENIDAHAIDWTDEMEREADRLHRTYRCPLGR
ncbi:aldo/keto reductase [uncultured Algimonas sp.]|uniref:aldo/keto reductase n=1 Tax=uncultured Algimonas sp. TaxID=1547920 RepID=UPI0026269FD7|nr:aldo/keto reductase [uncultured Algimonas sp.]